MSTASRTKARGQEFTNRRGHWVSPAKAAELISVSVSCIYQWTYRDCPWLSRRLKTVPCIRQQENGHRRKCLYVLREDVEAVAEAIKRSAIAGNDPKFPRRKEAAVLAGVHPVTLLSLTKTPSPLTGEVPAPPRPRAMPRPNCPRAGGLRGRRSQPWC